MSTPLLFRRRPLTLAVSIALTLGALPNAAQAVTRTWDGNGLSNNWSYINTNPLSFIPPNLYRNTNWTDSASCLFGCSLPLANGDALVFSGTTGLTPNNDLIGGSYAGISFAANAGAFTLNGNAITSTGNISNLSNSLQTINMPITVGSNQTWDGGTAGMKLNGVVALGNHALTLSNNTVLDNHAARNFSVGALVGNASLTILSGSRLMDFDGVVGIGTAASTTVDGAGSSWENTSDLYIGMSATGELKIQNGGTVSNGLGYIGSSTGATGTVTVDGLGSQWLNRVGQLVNGVLNIQRGGKVISNGKSFLGYWSPGTATVNGNDSLWTNGDHLYIGYSGSGTLNIQNGGTVKVGRGLSIMNSGLVNLDGGTLSAESLTRVGNGRFNWSGGTLNITGITGASLGSGELEALTQLDSGKTLDVTHTLYVNSGALLFLRGGNVKAGTLALNGGSIVGGALDMAGIRQLSGYGTVAITGGTAANTIQASGGNLVLGDVNSITGFDFGGNLNVGGNRVVLLDQDQAQLGVSTTLDNGGQLEAGKGIRLSSGDTLTYTGNASILGNFTNNGEVSGSGGALTFLNDVNGAGSFGGDIVFHAAYNPGNSPASVNFNGGNARYDATSVLTMEILGDEPGAQYDQLLNIGDLSFEGILHLVFGPSFIPANQSLALFDFKRFSGSLAADRIIVSGIDRALLDFSHLSSSGRLQIAAVPLPAGIWLFGSGLALQGLVRRKSPR